MKQLFRNFKQHDPDIDYIMDLNYQKMHRFVGSQFKSMHQYLLITTGSIELLNKAHSILNNEIASSGLMFSAMEALYKDDVERLLRTIYSADQGFDDKELNKNKEEATKGVKR